jgi:hypothetical protein
MNCQRRSAASKDPLQFKGINVYASVNVDFWNFRLCWNDAHPFDHRSPLVLAL